MAKKRQVLSKADAWRKMQVTLYKKDTRPPDAEMVQDILIPFYVHLEQLRKGEMDRCGYVELNELAAFAFTLAGYIHDRADQALMDIIGPLEMKFLEAGKAIKRIGERYHKFKKFGASGEDLQTLTDMVHWLEQLFNISTRGLMLAAQLEAQALVYKTYGKQ